MANVLSTEMRSRIVSALVEGNSIRTAARIVGVSKNTVQKLLLDLGAACSEYQDRILRDLPCKRLQVDEIWSFVCAKAKNLPEERCGEFGYGDVWTFTAIDADTKLVPAWLVGPRDGGSATEFLQDLEGRLASGIQLTSYGHTMFLEAVEGSFGSRVDYAMLQKIYGTAPEAQRRYSPPECIGVKLDVIQGDPDPAHVSTSYVERQNLTMWMTMRRFTRLTNAFSKRLENHMAAISLHFCFYNSCRPHRSLRTEGDNRRTPAMAAGIARRPLTVQDLIGLLSGVEPN
jgi:IS1 family transposase